MAETGSRVAGDVAREEILSLVALLAKDTVAGAEEVSVTLVGEGDPFTVASTDPLAGRMDALQYAAGAGPCLLAGTGGVTQLVEDVTAEVRWPAFARGAAEAGVRSVLSTAVPGHGATVGSVNIYSRAAAAFDARSRQAAHEVAEVAAAALAEAGNQRSVAGLTDRPPPVSRAGDPRVAGAAPQWPAV
ncbi:GAF domain-containing protein [Rhodococcus sp. X156]|uniref:GAF domain-containing protein n=1 Tax=Rhodococcus sp. X156 TaxID=2499145 RepID=UPI000FD9059F|nr:GAF domain-containing protein [Rhodococcus sp. X156]